jgi:hypothetical protein
MIYNKSVRIKEKTRAENIKKKSNILFCFPKKKEKEEVEKMVVYFLGFKSISSGPQYLTLMYSFATPPLKLKLGQQIGGGLLIANHLDQSL